MRCPALVPAAVAVVLAAEVGCLAGSGSVELVLDVPEDPALAPQEASSVTLVATVPGAAPRATTSLIDEGGSFDLGEMPVARGIDIAVELRDVSQRVVGYGHATDPVSVSADDEVRVVIPVRRPFVYATGADDQVVTFDSSLDADDGKYQGAVRAPLTTLAVPAGGESVVLVGMGTARQLRTIDNHLGDEAMALPADVRDAVASPDGRWLLVGHGAGLAAIDLIHGATRELATGAVERVAIAGDGGGGLRAVGLIGRAVDTECGAASKLVIAPLWPDTGEAAELRDLARPITDIGASPSQPAVVGTDACDDKVVAIGGDGVAVPIADVRDPTTVAVLGSRAFAVGSEPGLPDDVGGTRVAARLVLVSVDIGGGSATRAELPPIVQTMLATNVVSKDVARNVRARSATALDVAVVPPGNLVAVAFGARFVAPALSDGIGFRIFPELTADTNEYLLVDVAKSGPVQRVLTRCELVVGGGSLMFPTWDCQVSPEQDLAEADPFIPRSVAVLYGAR